MSFARIAGTTIRTVEKVPVFVWAGWIVAIVVATAVLAYTTPPLG